jgi:hypothetical protein
MKNVYQKYFAVFKKCPGNPNSKAGSNNQVSDVGGDDVVCQDGLIFIFNLLYFQ